MKRHYSAPGDEIASRQPVTVRRYKGYTRLNHWVTAGSLIVLALSGLALGDFPLSGTNQGQVHQGLTHGGFRG